MIACDLDLFSRYSESLELYRLKIREIIFDNSSRCKTLEFYGSLMEQYAEKRQALEIYSAYDGCYEMLEYIINNAKTKSEPLIERLRTNSVSMKEIKMTDLPTLMLILSAGLSNHVLKGER